MADKRQKRKRFLSVYRLIVTVDRLNLSFPIERFQQVEPFLFLILKSTFSSGADGGARSDALATAAAPLSLRELNLISKRAESV
jgi:hypothetical protein